MSLEHLLSVEDFRRRAFRRLPRVIYDYIDGGAGDEAGVDAAAQRFAQWRIVPRYLVDITVRNQQTILFGHSFDSPFGIAPTGYAGVYRPGAELMLARAARAANIPIILSGSGVASVEAVAEVAGANTWFQLYAAKSRATSLDLIRRSADCGLNTLVITVDIPVQALRYRDRRNGFSVPPRLTPRLIADVLTHPRWLLGYLRQGGLPVPGSWVPYAAPGASAAEVAAVMRDNAKSRLTWDDIAAFRQVWPGNLVLKGLLHPADARRAHELGVDGIILSSHGGRQFDRAPLPLDLLPEIVAELGGRMAIMLDGGITRGVDVLVARALGADFVFTGRATLWGVTADGQAGAQRVIAILHDEIDNALAQTGYPTLAEIAKAQMMRAG